MLAAKLISKKKAIIYLIILAGLILVSFFAYKYFAKSYSAEQGKAGQDIHIAPDPDLAAPAQLDKALVGRILNSQLFKKLKKHGDWPVKVDVLGRVNPFQEF
ncbi:MAG: hypothetical protein V1684_02795 [bacterium]